MPFSLSKYEGLSKNAFPTNLGSKTRFGARFLQEVVLEKKFSQEVGMLSIFDIWAKGKVRGTIFGYFGALGMSKTPPKIAKNPFLAIFGQLENRDFARKKFSFVGKKKKIFEIFFLPLNIFLHKLPTFLDF